MVAVSTRQIFDVFQGIDEEIVYQFTTTNWGTTPTSISAVAKDNSDLSDVTSTVFPNNNPTSDGDVISLSPLKALSADKKYRIEVKFTANGNIFELYGFVTSEL